MRSCCGTLTPKMVAAVILAIYAQPFLGAVDAFVTGSSQSTTTPPLVIVQGPNVPINQLLQQSSISSTFYSFWVASQVSNSLFKDATYTLFVPTNAAWNRLPVKDQLALSSCLTGASCGNQLQTVIRYHMWIGSATTTSFNQGPTGSCSTSYGADSNTFQCLTWAPLPGGGQTHVALTKVANSWYVNGARITISDQQAQSFSVHFIDKWLYPVDSSNSASAYLFSASSSTSNTNALVSQSCSLCSPLFSNLWATVTSGALSNFYTWAVSTVGSPLSGITMFIPYAQPLASQYSINTLASMIQALQTPNANLNALAQIASVHVIPNRVLYLAPWIAAGARAYSCGPSNVQTMPQFVQLCDLTQFNSTTWGIEVGKTSAAIIYPDIPVENGVVHIVSNVLNFIYGTLWDVVQVHPSLTKFKTHLQSDVSGTALSYLQSSNNQYTVFAPDDSCFNEAIESALSANSSLLSLVLQLGIVSGTLTIGSMQSQATSANPTVWSSPTVVGNRLRYSITHNGTQVDGGSTSGFVPTFIVQPDLGGTNGILQIVSGNIFGLPLLTVAQFLLSRSELTQTAAYLGELTQAWSLLNQPGGPYTVIAPTNAAWIALAANNALSVITQTSQSSVLLENLLLRHYMAGDSQLHNYLINSGSSYSVPTLNGVITFTALSMSPPQFQVSHAGSVMAYVNASDFICTNGRVHIINSVLAVPADAYNNVQTAHICQNPLTCGASWISVNCMLLIIMAQVTQTACMLQR